MPHPCVVCGRSRMNPNNREEEYMFFSFPVNDETRCRQWLEFCGREDLYKLSKKQLLQRMVCSKHFQPQDFLTEYLDRLHSNAIPSVYDPTQSLYNITCTLCNRSRQDPPEPDYDGTTFHHFPGEEFRCLKWLDFVGVESYFRLTRKEILFCYICSKHFDRSQFVPGYKGRLVENAVPSIRYPKELDESEFITVAELPAEPKLFAAPERCKKPTFLSHEVLESQACAACGRLRSDPRNKLERYKFHPFPAYEIGRCLRWCQFLGREDLLSMSPNQIRKLVLCSRHFQTGQNFHKSPCDAVPTIKDVSKSLMPAVSVNVEEQYVSEDVKEAKEAKRFSRPLVSSKKPKMDNKPAPLAKKRGKSRRPTSINIPRPDLGNMENRIVRKLPLPSANWKIQLGEQLQSMAINNVVSNVTTANSQTDGPRKVIMPITWDISNLGAPIPVHSLSSIPPGLLIKINLPEQKQQKEQKSPAKKQRKMTDKNASNEQTWLKNNGQTSVVPQKAKSSVDKKFMELLSMSTEATEETLNSEESQKEMILSHPLKILTEKDAQIKEEHYFEELEASSAKKKKVKRRRPTGTLKRSIFPITCEVNRFLRKLMPLMHRLPKRARAQMKLSIVNMVIDHL